MFYDEKSVYVDFWTDESNHYCKEQFCISPYLVNGEMFIYIKKWPKKLKSLVVLSVLDLFPTGLFPAGLFPALFSPLGLFPAGLFPARSFPR